MIKKLAFIFSIFIFLFVLASCRTAKVFNISIIATSDVHCGIEDNITYAGISEFRNERKNSGYKTTLVDCGDFIQGASVGLLSKGKDVIKILNKVGYDFLTIGNHEFDYGMDELKDRIDEFNGDVLSCNIKYTGKNDYKLYDVKPYKIVNYDGVKVGFVGITTPESTVSSTPSVFMEDNEFVYSFSGETPKDFYNVIQNNINICRDNGAKYVILLSHLGYGDEYQAFGSVPTMQNLTGYDVILDGHSHKKIDTEYYEDSKGKEKPLICLGTKLDCFSEIIITNKGIKEIKLHDSYDKKDEEITTFISSITRENEEFLNSKVSTSDIKLDMYTYNGENKIRLTRNRETALGNFHADAYRYKFNTDIALINGGGIRSGFDVGDITYKKLYEMAPYGNYGCVIEVTGQQLLDYLEFGSHKIKAEQNDGNAPIGEFGGFPSVSGLKFTIDTNVESTIEFDTNGMVKSLGVNRRIKDVYVLNNGEYKPIDITGKYTVAGINYVLLNKGDGNTLFDDAKVLTAPTPENIDVNVLKDYFLFLNGNIQAKYNDVEGRINII